VAVDIRTKGQRALLDEDVHDSKVLNKFVENAYESTTLKRILANGFRNKFHYLSRNHADPTIIIRKNSSSKSVLHYASCSGKTVGGVVRDINSDGWTRVYCYH
jgi:hypothetical protein